MLTRAPVTVIDDGDEPWLPEMAWTLPQYSKGKVNWAGEILIAPYPQDAPYESDEYGKYWKDYVLALDITNNWRSAHNFPLNTFHVGLRRRAKKIDHKCITAQRIKRISSIEQKLVRFPTMTLSQMQDIAGCRAILSSVANVKALCTAYRDSDIKHESKQIDDYITNPKISGYRGAHLIYRYFSDKKRDYNTLQIEIQIRSQLQHTWATAVETVGAFVEQALKSSLGEQEWLRFFALMGTAIAAREESPPVPNTPESYSELVKELQDHARTLDVANKLAAFGTALNITQDASSKRHHYYLIEVNHRARTLNLKGFKKTESDIATNTYLDVERKIKNAGTGDSDAVLVSVDSMDALRRAYPNYFLDTRVFVGLMNETLQSSVPPKSPG